MFDNTPNIPRITAWIEDLESGRYKQCRSALARTAGGSSVDNSNHPLATSYCCLGVAVVTAINSGYVGSVDWAYGVLSPSLVKWYGLPSANPNLYSAADGCACPDHTHQVTATEANDEHKLSFVEIAAKLRAKFGIPAA